MTIHATYTDTFGGNPNYSTVHRIEFEHNGVGTWEAVVRDVKKRLRIKDRTRTDYISGTVKLHIYGANACVFIEKEAP